MSAAKPLAIHVAEGSYRPERHAGRVDAPGGTPEPPFPLTAAELTIWPQVVEQLQLTAGLLAAVDGFALHRYVSDWAEWLELKAKIETTGRTSFSENGAEYQSPLVGMKNRADDRLRKFEAKFGMTPQDRAKISVEVESADDVGREFGFG